MPSLTHRLDPERCKPRLVNGLPDPGRLASDFGTLVLTRAFDL
jgi:hypothetical protein